MWIHSKGKQQLGCYSNEEVRGNVDSDSGARGRPPVGAPSTDAQHSLEPQVSLGTVLDCAEGAKCPHGAWGIPVPFQL